MLDHAVTDKLKDPRSLWEVAKEETKLSTLDQTHDFRLVDNQSATADNYKMKRTRVVSPDKQPVLRTTPTDTNVDYDDNRKEWKVAVTPASIQVGYIHDIVSCSTCVVIKDGMKREAKTVFNPQSRERLTITVLPDSAYTVSGETARQAFQSPTVWEESHDKNGQVTNQMIQQDNITEKRSYDQYGRVVMVSHQNGYNTDQTEYEYSQEAPQSADILPNPDTCIQRKETTVSNGQAHSKTYSPIRNVSGKLTGIRVAENDGPSSDKYITSDQFIETHWYPDKFSIYSRTISATGPSLTHLRSLVPNENPQAMLTRLVQGK